MNNRSLLRSRSAVSQKCRRRPRPLRFEGLEGRRLLDASGWQNPNNPYNVNDDYDDQGNPLVTPIDALTGYNTLNMTGPRTLPAPATPPPYFDVNGDGAHTPNDLLPVINYLFLNESGGGTYRGTVEVRLEAVDPLTGNPITSIKPGDPFLLRAYVKDAQPEPAGVFAAYLDVTYDPNLASDNGPITLSPEYGNVKSVGNSMPGLLDEVGGVSFLGPLGAGDFLVFEMPLVAAGTGRITIASSPASGLGHEILAYGSDTPVPRGQIHYGSVTLDIVAPINFVDANNNQVFDKGIDVALVRGELNDGFFSTTKPEGGYTKVIHGAGLVINVDVRGNWDLEYSAQGNLVVNAALNAVRDIKLRGGAIDVHAWVAGGGDVILDADGRIDAGQATIHAGRDFELKANGKDQLVSVARSPVLRPAINLEYAQVTATRNIKIAAGRGSVSIVSIVATVGKKAEVKAHDTIFADVARVVAGRKIELHADGILGNPLLIAPKIKITTKK